MYDRTQEVCVCVFSHDVKQLLTLIEDVSKHYLVVSQMGETNQQ